MGVGAVVTPVAAGGDPPPRWANQTPPPATSAANSATITAITVVRRVCLFTFCPFRDTDGSLSPGGDAGGASPEGDSHSYILRLSSRRW